MESELDALEPASSLVPQFFGGGWVELGAGGKGGREERGILFFSK